MALAAISGLGGESTARPLLQSGVSFLPFNEKLNAIPSRRNVNVGRGLMAVLNGNGRPVTRTVLLAPAVRTRVFAK